MSEEDLQTCKKCGFPVEPRTVGEGVPSLNERGNLTVELQYDYRCTNENCSESGTELAPAGPTS